MKRIANTKVVITLWGDRQPGVAQIVSGEGRSETGEGDWGECG